MQSFEPPIPGPDRFPTTSASMPSINVPGSHTGPGRTPIPSSLLNNLPIHPPPVNISFHITAIPTHYLCNRKSRSGGSSVEFSDLEDRNPKSHQGPPTD